METSNIWLLADGFYLNGADSRGGAAVSGPLFDLGQFVDEEDAFALSLAAGLHDPGAGWVLAELLHKEVIISREHERHRNKICMTQRGRGYRQRPWFLNPPQLLPSTNLNKCICRSRLFLPAGCFPSPAPCGSVWYSWSSGLSWSAHSGWGSG